MFSLSDQQEETSKLKMSRTSLREAFSGMRARLHGGDPARKHGGDELPLRAELFSADQMNQHGKILAGAHQVKPGRTRDRLLPRLAENERLLLEVHHLLTDDVKADRRITPAGEWLLDNFYLIEEQIRTAKRHLPKGYSRELPHLLNGPSAGLPRVYDIALETISHGDGRVDPENLSSFVTAYQSVATLKLGELWAIPIMLRLALIENLKRVAARIAADRIDRNRADYWANQMTEIAVKDPKSLILAIADMARSNPPMVSSFVAELARRLQGQGPALALPFTWIEQRLSESGLTIEQLVRVENQQQAANQVSMSNSIGSLRFLGSTDWREFVESMSLVERTLGEDPADVYGQMDFATRDRYRHIVEKAAKHSPCSESEVARKAIQLAQAGAARNGIGDRVAHVGFYLIGDGLAQLERMAEVRFSSAEILRNLGPSIPFTDVWRRDPVIDGHFNRVLRGEGPFRWGAGVGHLAFRIALDSLRQPSGGRFGELAGNLAGDAAAIAENGFFQKHPAGISNFGGGADDAREHPERRGPGQSPGSPIPGKSGRPSPLRTAHRFSRRHGRDAAGRPTVVGFGAPEDRRA